MDIDINDENKDQNINHQISKPQINQVQDFSEKISIEKKNDHNYQSDDDDDCDMVAPDNNIKESTKHSSSHDILQQSKEQSQTLLNDLKPKEISCYNTYVC